MSATRFSIIALFLFSMLNAEAHGQHVWQKHPVPVVPVWGGDINDPSSYKYTFNPAVMFDTTLNLYRMWFSYQAFGFGVQWCIGYAVSKDGTNWFVYSRNPVLRPGNPGAFDSNLLVDPFVIKVGNELRMYYTGYNESIWQSGVATSVDGINWTKHPGNPILPVRPGTWESYGCNTPKVFRDGAQFVLFYTGLSSPSLAEVGLATSADGYVWQRSALNPVLRRGPSGSWDQNSIRAIGGFVGNGRYYLLYDGGPFTAIGFASSLEGVSWTKHPGNPVFFQGNPGTWDASRVEFGSVVREGSLLKFWYSGYGFSSVLGGSVWQIGYATSDFVTSTPEDAGLLPEDYSLAQAFPNPFNPETEIGFTLPKSEHVTLKVFDSLGQEVATLVDEVRTAGSYAVKWVPASIASGVYFYRMQAGTYSKTQKVVLMK